MSMKSNDVSSVAKKRSLLAQETPVTGNSTPSATGASSIGMRDKASPARTRTLPHDWLSKTAKRNSMPDSAHQSPHPAPSPWSASVPSSIQSQGLTPNFKTSGSEESSPIPLTGAAPRQIFANSALPDLNTVMFPNDNPFAYPNQPISTLEDTQYMTPEQSLDAFSIHPNDANGIPMPPSHTTMHPDYAFEALHTMSPFTNSHFPPYFPQQSRNFPSPMANFNLMGVTHTDEPIPLLDGSMNGIMNNQGGPILSQQPYGIGPYDGNRPGIPTASVNLNELFGGDNWGMNGNTGPWEATGTGGGVGSMNDQDGSSPVWGR